MIEKRAATTEKNAGIYCVSDTHKMVLKRAAIVQRNKRTMVRTGCVASQNVNSRFSSLFASLPRMQHNPIKSLQNFFFTLSLSTINASLPLDGGNSPCTITVLFVSIHSNNCTTQILSANRFIRCSPVFRCVSIISIPICPECPCVYILIRSVCFHSA